MASRKWRLRSMCVPCLWGRTNHLRAEHWTRAIEPATRPRRIRNTKVLAIYVDKSYVPQLLATTSTLSCIATSSSPVLKVVIITSNQSDANAAEVQLKTTTRKRNWKTQETDDVQVTRRNAQIYWELQNELQDRDVQKLDAAWNVRVWLRLCICSRSTWACFALSNPQKLQNQNMQKMAWNNTW